MSDGLVDFIVFVLAVAGSGALGWWQHKHGSRDITGFLPRVDEEFRQILITEASPECCFDGRSAVIVHEERDYADEHLTAITCVRRYARNAYGEYFFFLSEGRGRPYFKHIKQRAAKAALGDKYIPPPSAVA